jgi:hypothetical protein
MEGKTNRPHAPGSWLTITLSAAGADLGWVPGEIIQFHFVNGGLLPAAGGAHLTGAAQPKAEVHDAMEARIQRERR